MEGRFPLKSDFEWKKLGESYILTNKLGASIVLDTISFLVWIQCDGKTGIEQIVDVFSIGGNRDIIHAALTGVLQKLTESGAIVWV
jgi:hypothetical protein